MNKTNTRTLEQVFQDLTEWHMAKFPNPNLNGLVNHIREELVEFEAEIQALTAETRTKAATEIVDVIILSFQALRVVLQPISDETNTEMLKSVLEEKLSVLKDRQYPTEPDQDGKFKHLKGGQDV